MVIEFFSTYCRERGFWYDIDNGEDNVVVDENMRFCSTFSRGRQRSSFVGVGRAGRVGGPPDVLVIKMMMVMMILEMVILEMMIMEMMILVMMISEMITISF